MVADDLDRGDPELGPLNDRDADRHARLLLVDGDLGRLDTRLDQRQPGMLINGCYNKRIGLATSNELIWGDYFLLEALLTLQGKLNTVIL